MRKILTILLLILSLTAWGTRVYVATTGSDGTGDGSAGAPYLTIAHAIGQASAGDTVYVNAGTYTITSQVAVPVGISIMGAGETSILLAGDLTVDFTAAIIWLLLPKIGEVMPWM